jgi:hypothetical protein
MKNSRKILLWIFLLAIIILFLAINSKPSLFYNGKKYLEKRIAPNFVPKELPFSKGEKIIYNVRLFGIKIGKSELLFAGETQLNKRSVELIIFSTNVINLKDIEKIYVESDTFLPIRVERSVNFFGRKIYIVEDYNIKENSMTIYETEGSKVKTQVFKSDKPIQNIISLLFLFRRSEDLDIGQKFSVSVPLLNFDMQVTELVDLDTANKKYKAYLLESVPEKYRIWIDASPKKIPLRLDGAVAFGNTAMIMTQFIPGEN